MAREIIWEDAALDYLTKALDWISEESYLQAEKIENAILEKINLLKEHPDRFPPDKFKKENLGNYRAFETHNYRIAYTYTENEIQILRVRHVKQEPQEY